MSDLHKRAPSKDVAEVRRKRGCGKLATCATIRKSAVHPLVAVLLGRWTVRLVCEQH
jgi:hypothetical protein